jgi:hypothetical protein
MRTSVAAQRGWCQHEQWTLGLTWTHFYFTLRKFKHPWVPSWNYRHYIRLWKRSKFLLMTVLPHYPQTSHLLNLNARNDFEKRFCRVLVSYNYDLTQNEDVWVWIWRGKSIHPRDARNVCNHTLHENHNSKRRFVSNRQNVWRITLLLSQILGIESQNSGTTCFNQLSYATSNTGVVIIRPADWKRPAKKIESVLQRCSDIINNTVGLFYLYSPFII